MLYIYKAGNRPLTSNSNSALTEAKGSGSFVRQNVRVTSAYQQRCALCKVSIRLPVTRRA